VIASPNFTHADVMRDALATTLPILVEKPLVTRIADGVDLIQRAKGREGIVWVAQEYRYMPPVAEMIRIAHEGGVGQLHQVSIREHREPFYPKVGDWNRFNANTGGTLVEKCCHYFNLMDFILKERPARVFASGGQRVNHLDERYAGPNGQTVPDILDSAYVIVEYPSGARASLDLCMFAENSVDSEQVVDRRRRRQARIRCCPSGVLRYGRREDWGRREVLGAALGHGARRGGAPDPRHQHQVPRAAFRRQLRRAPEVRPGRARRPAAEIPLDEGLRAVATGLAAHKSIDEGRVGGAERSAAGRLVGPAQRLGCARTAARWCPLDIAPEHHDRSLPPPRPSNSAPAPCASALRPDLGGAMAGFWHDDTPVLRSCEAAELQASQTVGVLSRWRRTPTVSASGTSAGSGATSTRRPISTRATRIRCTAPCGRSLAHDGQQRHAGRTRRHAPGQRTLAVQLRRHAEFRAQPNHADPASFGHEHRRPHPARRSGLAPLFPQAVAQSPARRVQSALGVRPGHATADASRAAGVASTARYGTSISTTASRAGAGRPACATRSSH
jgi:predicted dehydrogenase